MAAKPQWKEISRRPKGLELCSGGTYAYVHLVYEVEEVRRTKTKGKPALLENRIRMEYGRPLYLRENRHLAAIFSAAIPLYATLFEAALCNDEAIIKAVV
jgi:hypothetical protein